MSRGGGAAARAGAALTVNFSSLRPSTFQALCTRTWESASARSGISSARLPPPHPSPAHRPPQRNPAGAAGRAGRATDRAAGRGGAGQIEALRRSLAIAFSRRGLANLQRARAPPRIARAAPRRPRRLRRLRRLR